MTNRGLDLVIPSDGLRDTKWKGARRKKGVGLIVSRIITSQFMPIATVSPYLFRLVCSVVVTAPCATCPPAENAAYLGLYSGVAVIAQCALRHAAESWVKRGCSFQVSVPILDSI